MKTNPPPPMPQNLLKGIAEELRVQAHLGVMNLKDRLTPWLDKVESQARDFAKRHTPKPPPPSKGGG